MRKRSETSRLEYHSALLLLAMCIGSPFLAQAEDDVLVNTPDSLVDELAPDPLIMKFQSWQLVPGMDTGVESTDNADMDDTKKKLTYFAQSARLKLSGDFEGTDLSLRGRSNLLLPLNADSSYRTLDSKVSFNVKHAVSDSTTLRLKTEFDTEQDDVSPNVSRVQNSYEMRPSIEVNFGKNNLTLEALAGKTWFPGYTDFDDERDISPKQRNNYGLTASLSRDLSDTIAVYGGVSARMAQYDTERDLNDLQRGGLGYLVFAGLRGSLTEKVEMDLSVAGVKQTFLDPSFKDKIYASTNGYLQYKATEDLRFNLETYTGISESLDFGGAARFYRLANAGAEYKLTDDWVVTANGRYEWADYLYSNVKERTATLAAGLNYQVAPYGLLSFNYEKTILDNDDPLFSYSENRFFAKMSIN